MSRFRPLLAALVLPAVVAASPAAAGTATTPAPGTPEYVARDLRNVQDAYGRQSGQQLTPEYLSSLVVAGAPASLGQLADQAAAPGRPAITPGNVVPGWNVGNPLRHGWDGTRGQRIPVAFTNRYGALLRGSVFAPLPGARDPYTGRSLGPGPYPGVVITTGSVQGSERMYWWLAQDLAERGYVVLTYDVQGQGTSETLPHQGEGPINALPFCNPFAEPADLELLGCPGVPSQQPSNFVHGTTDALDFFTSTPDAPYANPGSEGVRVHAHNPLWKLWDRSTDAQTETPGRTTRLAIVGHSLGAAAVSYLQGVDERVQTVIALDKLGLGYDGLPPVQPKVPALGIQSEYGFTVAPYTLGNGGGGSSLAPAPGSPTEAPDPERELATGFDAWQAAGVDSMVVVPRASTHLEYTDIPFVLPASRYGQALSSVYVQRWLQRYLKHQPADLLDRRMRYLEPKGYGIWSPISLDRDALLSYGFCSGYALDGAASRDLNGVGC